MATPKKGLQDYLTKMLLDGMHFHACAGVPDDALSGHPKGCLVVDTTNGALYINTGTASSTTYNNIQAIVASEITLATGSILVGTAGVAAALDAKTSGQILVGSGTTVASVAVSGDATLSAAGVVTVTGATGAFNHGTNDTWTKEVAHTSTVSDSTTANTAGASFTQVGAKGTGTAAGGALNRTSGASSNGTAVSPGASGAITDQIGTPGTATTGTAGSGGTHSILGATGGNSTGASSTAGNGSNLVRTTGAGGASSGGGDTGGNGGSIIDTVSSGGTGATVGRDGAFFRRNPSVKGIYLESMPAPAAKTTDATLSIAELLGGWVTVNQAAGGTSTLTTPTGTQIAAALPTSLAAGDCFDFCVINISTVAAEDAILAGGTDVTIVGDARVASRDAAGEKTASGKFRFRYSGANVWVIYRVA